VSEHRSNDMQRSATDTTGPPGREKPRGSLTPGLQLTTHDTADDSESTTALRQCAAGRQLRRRRGAADRCEPLHGAGNVRDPWQPWRPEKLPEKQIHAAAATATHLLAHNLWPIFDLDMLRAMWRAGYRSLVDTLRGVASE